MNRYEGYARPVNYYETDKMAVVHHSNYSRYLEECRMDFFEKCEMPLSIIEEAGFYIPVTELYNKYIKSLVVSQKFRVLIAFEKFSPVRIKFSYKIIDDETGELYHYAETAHCMTTVDGTPVSIKAKLPEVYAKLQEMYEANKPEGDSPIKSPKL